MKVEVGNINLSDETVPVTTGVVRLNFGDEYITAKVALLNQDSASIGLLRERLLSRSKQLLSEAVAELDKA